MQWAPGQASCKDTHPDEPSTDWWKGMSMGVQCSQLLMGMAKRTSIHSSFGFHIFTIIQMGYLNNPNRQNFYNSGLVRGYRKWNISTINSLIIKWIAAAAAAAAKLLQSCLTLGNPIDGSPPGFSVPGILQARILDWVAISFSTVCMHAKSLQSCLTLCDLMDSSPPGSSVHRIL